MWAIVFAIGAGLCWGIGEVATRSVLHGREVGPFAAIAVRSTVALPIIWAAYFAATRVWRSPREVEAWVQTASTGTWAKLVIGSGIVAGAVAMICFYAALSLGEISKVKPIAFAMAPATGVILGWLLLGEDMNLRKAIGVAIILLGVIVLTKG